MKKLEISKLIKDYGDFRVEANTLDELRNYENKLVDRLYKAINVMQCCMGKAEQLKCDSCNGTGMVEGDHIDELESCLTCNGRGTF